MLRCVDARSMPTGIRTGQHGGAGGHVGPHYWGRTTRRTRPRTVRRRSGREYRNWLAQVFAEWRRVLEPGGRIAVKVANLGRKPYRSLSGEVLGILERLGFLIRGEHVWVKAAGPGGFDRLRVVDEPG